MARDDGISNQSTVQQETTTYCGSLLNLLQLQQQQAIALQLKLQVCRQAIQQVKCLVDRRASVVDRRASVVDRRAIVMSVAEKRSRCGKVADCNHL
jgi:hypothetical protein